MDVKPFATVGFEEYRCLHTGCGEIGGREIGLAGLLLNTTYFTQFATRIFVLLCIVVSGNPVSCDITRHCELSMFFFNNEVVEVFLLREDIAKTEAVIIEPELNLDVTVFLRLLEGDKHFVITVMDTAFFSPYRFPPIVVNISFRTSHNETVHQTIGFAIDGFLFFIVIEITSRVLPTESDSKVRRTDNSVTFMEQPINRTTFLHIKIRSKVKRWGFDFFDGSNRGTDG